MQTQYQTIASFLNATIKKRSASKMLATSSGNVHKPDDIKVLSDWGFDFILNDGVKDNFAWNSEVEHAHNEGMEYVARWPDYGGLGLVGNEKYAFQAYDGRNNAGVGGGRVYGPSHWSKEAEEICAKSIDTLVSVGLDGVLINALICDRWYPTDWYPFGDNAIQGTRYYWSWDDEAQAQWKAFSGGEPMIEACQCFEGACAEHQQDFYRWYQDGWISKLIRLTDVAIDAGMKHIWTWMVPHTDWTEVNMANGTADSILPVETWRQHVISRGAEPIVVVACHFALSGDWPVWFADSHASIKKATAKPLEWKLIVGAETVHSDTSVVRNLTTNSKAGVDIGVSGMLCGDKIALEAVDRHDEYKTAFLAAKKLFE